MDPLKLKLGMVVNHHVFAENQTCSLLPDLFFKEVRKNKATGCLYHLGEQ